MQFNLVQSVRSQSVISDRRVRTRAPSHQVQSQLTSAEYDRMSRAARAVSESNGFMDAFKTANPDWKPDFSKFG